MRLSLLSMLKTSDTGLPRASARVQPVSFSATGFRRVTRASASVAITASPMELSVTARFSSLSRKVKFVFCNRAFCDVWKSSKCFVSSFTVFLRLSRMCREAEKTNIKASKKTKMQAKMRIINKARTLDRNSFSRSTSIFFSIAAKALISERIESMIRFPSPPTMSARAVAAWLLRCSSIMVDSSANSASIKGTRAARCLRASTEKVS